MDFWRQLDIISPADLERLKLIFIGAGGIGSWATLIAVKMGVSQITVFDADLVEAHNPPNQIYRPLTDQERPKVECLAEICQDFADVPINPVSEMFESQGLAGVVVSGVDSMAARQAIWKRVKFNPNVVVYIDGRMSAEVMRICTVRPCDLDDIKWYEETLHSDEESSEEPCTRRAIAYNAAIIGGLINNQIKRFAVGQECKREIIFDLATTTLITD